MGISLLWLEVHKKEISFQENRFAWSASQGSLFVHVVK